MRARFLFLALVVFLAAVARGEGSFQRTRNGKVLVWNDDPKAGDEATWSGGRDRDGYARGFGTLTWYMKEPGSDKPQLYALYWGNMVQGKLNGPVNLHSNKKTNHAIFANGARVTAWSPGTAPSRMTQQQVALIEQHNAAAVQKPEPEPLIEKRKAAAIQRTEPEPEPPAAGPSEQIPEVQVQLSDLEPESPESVQDLRSERWPKIDIDDSLRILVWPPRTLRERR